MDCFNWDKRNGMCPELGYRLYVPRDDYPELLRRAWTDLGMIRLEEWRYCAFYDGPQISTDVMVWPKQAVSDPSTTVASAAGVSGTGASVPKGGPA
jgi:hypothetical protein